MRDAISSSVFPAAGWLDSVETLETQGEASSTAHAIADDIAGVQAFAVKS